MQKPKNYHSQRGFAHIVEIVVLVVVLAGILFVYKHMRHSESKPNASLPKVSQQSKSAHIPPPSTEVSWHLADGHVWQASGTPPQCPEQPIFAAPVDVSLVTSVLYPGQVRGTAFKPHGGFRFDRRSSNDITVAVPMDAKLIRASKGLFDENGEIQYGFEFIAPCGIWYAFGHIHTLSPKFQAYADKLPLISDHSVQQLYDINPAPDIKAGEVIATQVGIVHTKNVFVEWQVDDLRQKNGKTIRAAWSQYNDQFDPYGVCWLDMLPAKDSTVLRALPGGDSVSGKQSDYCT